MPPYTVRSGPGVVCGTQLWCPGTGFGQTVHMGPLLIVIALVIAIPVAVIITGGVVSVILGHSLRMEGEYRNEDSELLELNA